MGNHQYKREAAIRHNLKRSEGVEKEKLLAADKAANPLKYVKRSKIRKRLFKHVTFSEPPTVIADWDELAKVPPSDTHYIKVEDGSGWIVPIDPDEDEFLDGKVYLSTHTFYGMNHEQSTNTLQLYGFNIVLENWDK